MRVRVISFEIWVTSCSAIARIALDILARQGQKAPPVDIDYVASGEGLEYILTEVERVSGGYFRDLDGHGQAISSSREHPLRQRFTKAHELGHWVLHARPDASRQTPGISSNERVAGMHPWEAAAVTSAVGPRSVPAQHWLARLSFVLVGLAVVFVAVFAELKSLTMLAVGLVGAAVSLAAAFFFLSRRGVWRWLSR